VNLKLQALKIGKTIYQVRQNIFAQFLENVLQNPICPVFVSKVYTQIVFALAIDGKTVTKCFRKANDKN
jgi:hypothetical protein